MSKLQQKTQVKYWEFLKQARSASKLTRVEVSKRIRKSSMTLWRWETGRETPSLENFEKWLEVFGLQIIIGFKNDTKK